MKLGVIASEFFDPALGGMGGFGWAARQVAQTFKKHPELGVELVFIATDIQEQVGQTETTAHGARVILRAPSRLENLIKMRRERFDLLLAIDYHLPYSVYLRSLPRTPAIIWSRDPRPPEDVLEIYTCRIPGEGNAEPQGLFCFDGRSMRQIVREAWFFRRKLYFATPAPTLLSKLGGSFGVEPPVCYFLPNIIAPHPGTIAKSEMPTVVFLGRLDPIKRPWLFVELARRFPHVEFLMLGQPHFHGTGGYAPSSLPSNVRVHGHVGEADKLRILSQAWVTVNTSIHEGFPVSFFESFACETVVLSGTDVDYAASRFGHFYGRFDGTGEAGLDAMELGLRRLLENHELRRGMGRAARLWVNSQHCEESFLAAFHRLRSLAGVA